jgi:hypothetical protein
MALRAILALPLISGVGLSIVFLALSSSISWSLIFVVAGAVRLVAFLLAIADQNELTGAGFTVDVDPLWALISSAAYIILRTRRVGAKGALPYVPVYWLVASVATGSAAFIWVLTLSALRTSRGA